VILGQADFSRRSIMAWNYYYKDRAGQNGPVSLDELVALARAGRIAPYCHVWAEGGEPGRADKIPALAEAFQSFTGQASSGNGPLQTDLPVWGLFWRSFVASIGIAFVIPAPWAGLWFYRWLAEHVALPGGRPLSLESSLSQCWYIFAGMGLAGSLGHFLPHDQPQELLVAQIIVLVPIAWLSVRLVDWFCRALRVESGGLSLAFEGGILPYFGWILMLELLPEVSAFVYLGAFAVMFINTAWAFFGAMLLLAVSISALIGWPWVLKYQMRWLCSKVVGTHAFEFVGTGWNLLWRLFVVLFAFSFLLPAPWALRWFVEWFVSQIVVTPRAAAGAEAMQAAA